MRIAVLGLGFMGATHARAIQSLPSIELAAVFSGDERKLSGDLSAIQGNLATTASRLDFSGARKYRELEDLLADRAIDAVDICLPTHLHDWVAIEAMRAGKHVLVEKPMALDAFGAGRMLSAARRSRRVLMTAHVLRFFPEYQALREALSGHTLRAATFRRSCATPAWSEWLTDPAQSGGGAFDLLIHDIDMALHLWGEPQSVAAVGCCEDSVDLLTAHLFYGDGSVVTIEGGWKGRGEVPFQMGYSVTTDRAAIEYNSDGRPPCLYPREGAPQPLPLKAEDPYAKEIAHFAEACRDNIAPPLCPPAESARAVELARLILDARTRKGAKLKLVGTSADVPTGILPVGSRAARQLADER